MNLFAYGTLMCEDIMEEVSGVPLSHVPGTLKGYSRRSVKGEHYPGLVPDAEGSVEGVVYRDVPDSAWDRLDRFEGEMYARRLVQIEWNDGMTLLAAAYVVRPEYLDRLDPSDWNFNEFLRKGKAGFQKDYKGFRSLVP
ncbi:MAG: gamma-glutamylcyclotransferase family protein [Thermodesulfobacteriota bacterium]